MAEQKCKAARCAAEVKKHKTRRLTVSSAMDYPEYKAFASLRIKGKWLEAAGFPIGTPVEVVVEDGRMVVTALAVEEKPEKVVEISALAKRKSRDLQRFKGRIEMKLG
ncbi:SymE family type I addiction module toxin [Enterobacter sp. 22452]|uniref:SymE family type I addiction module toxin n=1 Tax=Enterobacter TaxID=547 RepID=UPI003F85DA30